MNCGETLSAIQTNKRGQGDEGTGAIRPSTDGALRKGMLTKKCVLLTLLAVLLVAGAAAAQEVLTNQSVVDMVTAGLPDDVIIAKIKSSRTNFDLSTPALAKLTQAKVSSAVMKAMIEPGPSGAAPAAATATPTVTDPNDPMAPHDPGIYLMTKTREGQKKMVLIERAGSKRVKTAHIAKSALTMGVAKGQIRAEVPGPQAAVRADVKPEFYMYFPPTGNLGSADMISSPSQFSMVRLEQKKDHRETTVAKQGFGRASAGVDEKKTVEFAEEKLRPYAYKVTPNARLKAGEYAFVAATGVAGAASAQVTIYDFGVDE
jgi:hypothetical protein